MEYLRKICEIYVNPTTDSKRMLEMLINTVINTGFFVSECWERNGRFKFEVFEKIE